MGDTRPIAYQLGDFVSERLQSYSLTDREKEIVRLLLEGLSNKAIAQGCNITEHTVKDHLKHVYRKTGVSRRSALMASLLQFPGGAQKPPARAKGPAGVVEARQLRRRFEAAD